MDLCNCDIIVVVFWSVELCTRMMKGVSFTADPENVEIGQVEDLELVHEWFAVGSCWYVFDESDDLFLCSNECLHVGFVLMLCSPDGDCSDEVRVYVRVVDLDEVAKW